MSVSISPVFPFDGERADLCAIRCDRCDRTVVYTPGESFAAVRRFAEAHDSRCDASRLSVAQLDRLVSSS